MKVLVLAPLCNGEDVGESWCAYQFVRRLGLHDDVTLLTYTKGGRRSVAEQLPGVRVIEWNEPPLVGRAERFNSMLKPAFVPFYYRAKHWIRAALKNGEAFDLAHQMAPMTVRYPSPLAGFDLPYVIGPVGGSLQTPPGFEEEDTAAWYVRLRELDSFRLRRDPVLRKTYERAGIVLGIAPYVQEVLRDVVLHRFEVMSDTGIEAVAESIDRSGRSGPVRLLYVGRLVRTKGARDLIRAMSLARDLPVALTVAGDGFDRAACESLIEELDLSGSVTLLGKVPHEQVAELYRAADVFTFPSYREPGGIVVTEAMSMGLPVVVSDRGGPAYTVDDTCGIRVAVSDSPVEYAAEIARAIRRLVDSPQLREAMGSAARRRIAEIALWDNKVARLRGLYAELLSAR